MKKACRSSSRPLPVEWDMDYLFRTPKTFPAKEFSAPAVKSLFFDSVPYKGKPTRVFAWMGMPYLKKGTTCPGVVLIHGGGGKAYDEWVRLWNARGYAAIAMDLCGCVPVAEEPGAPTPWRKHARGGPNGWHDSFDQMTEPVEDHWQYHAIAAVLRGHSLLAAQPGVDPERIGATGISWGGYTTSIVSGVDPRLAFAVPVYGCGFIGENSCWKYLTFPDKKPKDIARWLSLWDPSLYLPSARMPMLWVSGTNDFAYPLDSFSRSAALPKGESRMCVRVEMAHGHIPGWAPVEIGVFADSVVRDAAPFPEFAEVKRDGQTLRARYVSARPVRANLRYTRAEGCWADRKYNTAAVKHNPETGELEAPIPLNATVCYLDVEDDRGCLVSSAPVILA